jgi:hypothetical protein
MIHRIVVVLVFFGLLMTTTTAVSYIAKAQTPGNAVQSGTDVGGVDRHLFCNTGIMTPICE